MPVPATQGTCSRPTERILYLQVSETMVDLVVIQRQGVQPEYEEYRYPHTGSPNAVSDLQIVEFVPKQHSKVRQFNPWVFSHRNHNTQPRLNTLLPPCVLMHWY
jgi:hypothetical protein